MYGGFVSAISEQGVTVTQPPDHPAAKYPTCATIPGPLHQVS
jgi:hypothetical protein